MVPQCRIDASPANPVSEALTASGLYEERTRLAIQRQLDRGEARHPLARRLFFANRGEFRVGEHEEVVGEASCLGLLSNAAALWNAAQIERVVGRLRASGAAIDPANLAHVWRLQHARIVPNGTYLLAGREARWPRRRRRDLPGAYRESRTDAARMPSVSAAKRPIFRRGPWIRWVGLEREASS